MVKNKPLLRHPLRKHRRRSDKIRLVREYILWAAIVYGIVTSNQDIVNAALDVFGA